MKELAVDKKAVLAEENIAPSIVTSVEQDEKKEDLNRGCPLGVSRVSEALVVCGAHACPGAVRALRPAAVVSAAPELPALPHARLCMVPLLDTPDSDIYPYLDTVADLVHEVHQNGGCTLVHCVAGVSRSVTLCLAYLMKYKKMTLQDSYHYLKLRRPQIRPNTGFFKQLIKYEQRLFGEASVKMVYCEAIDKEIPDVYEPDYRGMEWFRKRYGPIVRT